MILLRKNYKFVCILILLCAPFFAHAADLNQRNCIILLDDGDLAENIGRSWRHYLMTRLQSAIAEQAAPILCHASLFNSFMERRNSFCQRKEQPGTREKKTLAMHNNITERSIYWSAFYNATSGDVVQNKALVAQRLNEEFYETKDTEKFSDEEYQFLLNYFTSFDFNDWHIYSNERGFNLLVPKKYSAQYEQLGFKINSLVEIHSHDICSAYFESRDAACVSSALFDFFMTIDDFPDKQMPFSWNLVLAGHGGCNYEEANDDGTVIWKGEPIIADMSLEEFKTILSFFDEKLKTKVLHYSSCYGGGNHIALGFERAYSFVIICDPLTDCFSFCKWKTMLPSSSKKFLTSHDLRYDAAISSWQVPLESPYRWQEFFKNIEGIDFSVASIERLPELLPSITFHAIADTALLCLPKTTHFFPVHAAHITKIDDRLLALVEKEDATIPIHGSRVILIESDCITPTIAIDTSERCRFISIKPGPATHYFKKLKAMHHIDLPNAFWQAEGQLYDKLFLIDECIFPHSRDSQIFKDVAIVADELVLKNVFIIQQKNYGIRIFLTIGDTAMMVVAHKRDFLDLADTVIQEIVPLSADAKEKYECYYQLLKARCIQDTSSEI